MPRDLACRLAPFVDAARRYSADEHARDYNETWREAAGAELTPETFLAACRLTDLFIHATGETTLWFDAGDLFAGHIIEVRADAAGRFVSTDLLG